MYLVLYCCTTYYIPDMYLYIRGAATAAVVAAAAAADRHRAPEGKKNRWFIESDSIQSFLALQTRFIFSVCTD